MSTSKCVVVRGDPEDWLGDGEGSTRKQIQDAVDESGVDNYMGMTAIPYGGWVYVYLLFEVPGE